MQSLYIQITGDNVKTYLQIINSDNSHDFTVINITITQLIMRGIAVRVTNKYRN